MPSLYFAEGLPYFVVMSLSGIMYKKLGISNADIALYTSWLYLPWVIKPLWAPIVDVFGKKRNWIVGMQLFIGAAIAGVGLTIPLPNFFQYTLILFWLIAFSSATHDISADGFYMLGLREDEQAFFVGIRSTFYRVAMIFGQGVLVILAGQLENIMTGLPVGLSSQTNSVRSPIAWTITFLIIAALFSFFFIYHKFMLPHPASDTPVKKDETVSPMKEFLGSFASFFQKKKIILIILFLLLYRLGEAQLVKLSSLFMLDKRTEGGLELSTSEVGLIYGMFGVFALVIGGILGGYLVSKKGLKSLLWPMLIGINVPDLVYVYMSIVQPGNFFVIASCMVVESFGYGFGFTFYMMYMIYISKGEYQTSHYALATGFMALGMMIPGMFSGIIQEAIGYKFFFIWVCLATIPGFIIAKFLPLEPEFGKKKISE